MHMSMLLRMPANDVRGQVIVVQSRRMLISPTPPTSTPHYMPHARNTYIASCAQS